MRFRFDHPSYVRRLTTSKTNSIADRYWWSDYKRHYNYTTLYLNDMCEDILETDFGGEGEWLDHHLVEWSCHPEYDAFGHYSNFVGPFSMRRRCIAGRYVHSYMFDYLKQAWTRYASRGVGRVAHATFIENHDGSMEVLQTMDRELANFIQWMHEKGHLRDTVLMITAGEGKKKCGPPKMSLVDFVL